MSGAIDESEIEIDLLLEGIYRRYHYDFRQYSRGSVRRRLQHALLVLDLPSLARLQERVLHDPATFTTLLGILTVQVSEMFRDPPFWRVLRDDVLPVLATYPSLKIWVAGASTGEEVCSICIWLEEAGLLSRSLVYATDIDIDAQQKAKQAVYELPRMALYSANYQAAGGAGSLGDYYSAAYDAAAIHQRLLKRVLFSDHSLATDSVFTEVHLVLCRNVLIYFDRELQRRAVGLFRDSLCRRGFLGLGMRESLRFIDDHGAFDVFDEPVRLYRRSTKELP